MVNNIPNDVFLYISQFLNSKEIIKLSETSRVISKRLKLYTLNLNDFYNENSKKQFSFLFERYFKYKVESILNYSKTFTDWKFDIVFLSPSILKLIIVNKKQSFTSNFTLFHFYSLKDYSIFNNFLDSNLTYKLDSLTLNDFIFDKQLDFDIICSKPNFYNLKNLVIHKAEYLYDKKHFNLNFSDLMKLETLKLSYFTAKSVIIPNSKNFKFLFLNRVLRVKLIKLNNSEFIIEKEIKIYFNYSLEKIFLKNEKNKNLILFQNLCLR